MPTDSINSLPANLRAERARRNLSRHELARRANVSPSSIEFIESGRTTNPKLSTIQRIAEAMGLSVDSLVPSSTAA